MEQEILEMVPKPRLVQQTIILMTGALKLMALKTRTQRFQADIAFVVITWLYRPQADKIGRRFVQTPSHTLLVVGLAKDQERDIGIAKPVAARRGSTLGYQIAASRGSCKPRADNGYRMDAFIFVSPRLDYRFLCRASPAHIWHFYWDVHLSGLVDLSVITSYASFISQVFVFPLPNMFLYQID
ncbi:hypothetical protein AOQ84DRAFT_40563 [Glonium stellatum]|uniref:Uncharacterized protein n=1 Tax=Glonium stellatum TaxID=574774 RepID=A0A8E2JT67_9PEZI|nr:hypothetical protein AOQ84DRAFT_40563 [Glonium stellatum]